MEMHFTSKVIMIIGSSMVQKAYDPEEMGFGIGLSSWYSRLADILLRGQSGYNSRWTLMSLKQIIGNHIPDMAVVFLGNNDSTDGGQFVPLDEFKSNVQSIVEQLRILNPNIAIILPTPTRANKEGRSNEVTAKYADVVRDIAEEHPRNALVDLWIGDISIGADDLCDGHHLGVSGNQKLLIGLKETIRESFPNFVPFNDANVCSDDKLNWMFPHWNKFQGKDIDESRAIINSCTP